MNEILRKLALSMIASQLADPKTREALHAYVDTQVDGFVSAEASALTGAPNVFLHALGNMLNDERAKSLLREAVNAEFDAMLSVVLERLK